MKVIESPRVTFRAAIPGEVCTRCGAEDGEAHYNVHTWSPGGEGVWARCPMARGGGAAEAAGVAADRDPYYASDGEDVHSGPARVVRDLYPYLDEGTEQYVIVGTPTGYLFGRTGAVRTWKTTEAAERALTRINH